jgi:hypothetical protein
MQTWLKLLGSVDKPLTDSDYHGEWKQTYIGFRKTRKPSIRLGDNVFFYAPGGSKRIFALAESTSEPESNPEYDPEEKGSCYWNVHVRYLINLPVNSGIHIDEITTKQRNLLKSIQRQSHIKLFPEEIELAERKLRLAESEFRKKTTG